MCNDNESMTMGMDEDVSEMNTRMLNGTRNTSLWILPKQDKSKLTQHTYTRIHLHAPPNPTCSQRYDHEWLKADVKPDPPPPPQSSTSSAWVSLKVPLTCFLLDPQWENLHLFTLHEERDRLMSSKMCWMSPKLPYVYHIYGIRNIS